MMHFHFLALTLFLFTITKFHCESSDPVSSPEEEAEDKDNTTFYDEDKVFRTRRMFKTAQMAARSAGRSLEPILRNSGQRQVSGASTRSLASKLHSRPFGTRNNALSQHMMNLLRENAELQEQVQAANRRALRLDEVANSYAEYAMRWKMEADKAKEAAAKVGSPAGSFAFGTITGSALMALAFMASFAGPEPRVTVTKPGETPPINAQATHGGSTPVVPQTTTGAEQKKPEAKPGVDDFTLESDAIFKSIRERAPEEKEVAKAIGASYKFVLSDGDSHQRSWLVDLTGEKPVVKENSNEGANLVITTTDKTFMEIVRKEISAFQAVKEGKMEYKGGIFNAIKYGKLLQKALDPNNENGFKLDVPPKGEANGRQ